MTKAAWLRAGWVFPVLVALGVGELGASERRNSEPRRIVALAPSVAEIAADLLGKEGGFRIVGVSNEADRPDILKDRPRVGPFYRVNLEAVVGLQPDLVLATQDGNLPEQVERLRSVGVRVVVVGTPHVDSLSEAYRMLGRELGLEATGEKKAAAMEQELRELRRESERRRTKAPRVVLQIGWNPVVVVGGQGFLAEVLSIAGGRSVFADVQQAYPRPSREAVMARKPDVILQVSMDQGRDQSQGGSEWGKIPTLRVDADDLLRPGPGLVRAIRKLQEGLNGFAR